MTTQQMEEYAAHRANTWQVQLRNEVKQALAKIDTGKAPSVTVSLVKLVPVAIQKDIANICAKEITEKGYLVKVNMGDDQRDGRWCDLRISLTSAHPLVTTFKLFD